MSMDLDDPSGLDSSSEEENMGIQESPKRRKRPRPSLPTIVDVDDDMKSLDENGASLRKRGRSGDSDGDDDDDEHEEKMSHNRAPKRRRLSISRQMEARVFDWDNFPGAIVQIRLVNILCHANFEFFFHPQINIISGANGSGKSAIEAAISLALGCTAKQTNRGASINDIIRFGQDFGEISLWINNLGGERHPQYGDQIMIQRRLSRNQKSGSATWRVFDADGMHEVGRSHKTVVNLCDHFGYRISNPCVILKQDAAKQFLNSSRPKDKFKFFMDASNLSEHQKDLEDCRENVKLAEHNVHEAEAAQSAIVEAFQSAERTYQQYQYVQEAEEKIDILERAVKWKRFKHCQRQLQGAEQEYSKTQALLERSKERHQEEKEKFDAENARVTNQDVEDQELTDRIDAIDAAVRNAEKIYKSADQGLKKHESRIKSVRREIQKFDSQMKKKQKEIQEISQHSGSQGQELRKKFELRERIQSDMETARHAVDEAKSNALTCNHRSAIEGIQRDVTTHRDLIKKLKEDRSGAQQSLHGLNGRNDNSVDRFSVGGRGCRLTTSQILEEIQRQHRRFSRLPVGPLGQYVQLQDGAQGYVQQIMAVFGGNLFSFVCNNMRDRDALISIGRNLHANLRVIVRKAPSHGRHSVPANPCAREFPRVPRILDLVEITNDWAFNTLVDMSNPENSFVHGSLEETRQFLEDVSRFPGLKPHVRRVYTTGELFFVEKRGRTTASNPVRDQRPVLSSDTRAQQDYYENQIRQMDADLKKVEAECKGSTSQMTGLRKEMDQAQKQLQLSTKKITQLERTLDGVNREIESLEEENRNEDDEKVEIQGIQEDMQELEREKEEKQETMKEMEREKSKAEEHKAQLGNDLEREKDRLRDANDELVEWQEKLEKRMSSVENSRRLTRVFEKAIAKAEKIAEENQRKLIPLEEKLDQAGTEAKECGEDPTVNDSTLARKKASTLMSEIRGTREQADQNAKNLPDPEDITRRYEEAKEPYEQHMTRVHDAKENLTRLQHQLYERLSLYEQLKEQTAESVSVTFRNIMKRQGHNGTIRINFDHSELSIEVLMMGHESQKSLENRARLSQSQRRAEGAKTVNTKTLSGGERSFTQLSLIIALQEFTQSPFCIYDEFDVFMDDVNRGSSINQLIKTAKSTKRQYIFITPNDVTPMLKNEREMKCIRLLPPRS